MKIFVSFSGPRSKAVAALLHEWLRSVLQNAKPWFSEEISSGKRWSPEIAKQLEETQFGIVCLSQENLEEPWIHFEAGACSKSVKDDARVVPYLLDVTTPQIKGPMAEFQMRVADEQGTRQMVRDINLLLGVQGLRDDQLGKTFEMWWPELKAKLASIPPMEGPRPVARTQQEMIEEVLDRQRRIENMILENRLPSAWDNLVASMRLGRAQVPTAQTELEEALLARRISGGWGRYTPNMGSEPSTLDPDVENDSASPPTDE
jgi:hypothetical protein